jgi:Domain of unknown function (DUF1707)
MRASHEDRGRVVDALRMAGGDGRRSAGELDTRLGRALSARTLGVLAVLTADLPDAPAAGEVLVIGQHARQHQSIGPAHVLLALFRCAMVAPRGPGGRSPAGTATRRPRRVAPS